MSNDGNSKRKKKKSSEKEATMDDTYDPHVEDQKEPKTLDDSDIKIMTRYSRGIYDLILKQTEKDIKDVLENIKKVCGVKESDTGLAPPALWDLQLDQTVLRVRFFGDFYI